MKMRIWGWIILFALCEIFVRADTWYVSQNSPSDGPGTAWSNAFHTIQAAVDAASTNDTVVVSNGVYNTGGMPVSGYTLTNRICVTKALFIKSLGGPEETVIAGNQLLAISAVRCAYIDDGAVLSGFTLSNGCTLAVGDYHITQGGGVLCQGTGQATNCVIRDCRAYSSGGGAWGGYYSSCTFSNNNAGRRGGGVHDGILNHCLIIENHANYGGGIDGGFATNCTIRANEARNNGGGSYLSDLFNCLVLSNSASYFGGGSYQDSIANGVFYGNFAGERGGGAFDSQLESCTIVGNRAGGDGGGVAQGTVQNSIVYYNDSLATSNDNLAVDALVSNSCAKPLPPGSGNISDAPALQSLRLPRLVNSSSCINAGSNENWMVTASDIEGDPRISGGTVDMGADEVVLGAQIGSMQVNIVAEWINAVATQPLRFEANIEGEVQEYVWHWGDGTTTDDRCVCEHAYTHAGTYSVILEAINKSGTSAATTTVSVLSSFTTYVSPTGKHVPPFGSWLNAATNIQAAVDVCIPGGTVLVAEGNYDSGYHQGWGSISNRVVVNRPISILASGARKWTRILGLPTNRPPVRCVSLCDGSLLSGFTLSNGHSEGDACFDAGGGIWSEYEGLVSNCVVSGNSAAEGGGVFGGRLEECNILENTAHPDEKGCGGGASSARLWNCVLSENLAAEGGGIFKCTAENCTLIDNLSVEEGGGADSSTLNGCTVSRNESCYGGGLSLCRAEHCLLSDNRALYGGGADDSFLRGCTIIENTAVQGGGAHFDGTKDDFIVCNCTVIGNRASGLGGGIYGGETLNSIVYYNFATIQGNNIDISEFGTCNYSCTTPLPAGTGNTTLHPRLSGFQVPHIGSYSPCIDTGSNAAWMASATDLDGEPRISGATVDMGADEYLGSALTGDPQARILSESRYAVCGFPLRFRADCRGKVKWLAWIWDDGTTNNSGSTLEHTFSAPGDYAITLRALNSEMLDVATSTVHVVESYTNYVSLAGSHIFPYISPATAATNIQAAVQANPYAGGVVQVADGTYDRGGQIVGKGVLNRVAINNPLTLKSENGPAHTCIFGVGKANYAPVRCVYLGNRAQIEGFTLSYGKTGDWEDCSRLLYINGGGAYCEPEGKISGCIVQDCSSEEEGAGIFQGQVANTLICHCSAIGVSSALLLHCTALHTPTYECGMDNCIVGRMDFDQPDLWSNLVRSVSLAGKSGHGYKNYSGFLGTDGIFSDPCFKDFYGGDYHIVYGSPCIDTGIDLPSITNDLDGTSRPLDGNGIGNTGWDRGCYEVLVPTEDADGDSSNNYDEYIADTDPHDSFDFFRIIAFSNNPTATIYFNSSLNRNYTLLWSTNLTEDAWEPVANPRLGIGGSDSLQDTNSKEVIFYKLQVHIPPQ